MLPAAIELVQELRKNQLKQRFHGNSIDALNVITAK